MTQSLQTWFLHCSKGIGTELERAYLGKSGSSSIEDGKLQWEVMEGKMEKEHGNNNNRQNRDITPDTWPP